MSPYKYRGTIHDLHEDPAPRHQPTGRFNPDKCGTYAGYRAHQKYKIPACRDCKDAQAAYSRDYHERRVNGHTPSKGFNPDACGTYAGYARHLRSTVPPCDDCKAAHAEYMNDYRKKASA